MSDAAAARIRGHRLDAETMRFLEVHETLAHAIGGRTFRDLGDSVLLHAPDDPEPFFNRVGAIRWPESPGAFDRRLAEIVTLFGTLMRHPNVWAAAGHNTPADLGARLVAHGFEPQEGGLVMLLVRRPAPSAARPPHVTVERLRGGAMVPSGRVDEIAGLLVRAFGVDLARREAIAAETAEAFRSPAFHVAIVRDAGEPVAVGKRYTFDRASYLSSIGVDPRHRGRGYGSLVTGVLTRDAVADASRLVHLGVHLQNERAIEVYRRVGFEPVGEPALDYLLV